MMEQNIDLPSLADIVLKIKEQQELTAEEELVYLVHFEQMPLVEAQALVSTWYNQNT